MNRIKKALKPQYGLGGITNIRDVALRVARLTGYKTHGFSYPLLTDEELPALKHVILLWAARPFNATSANRGSLSQKDLMLIFNTPDEDLPSLSTEGRPSVERFVEILWPTLS